MAKDAGNTETWLLLASFSLIIMTATSAVRKNNVMKPVEPFQAFVKVVNL